MAQAVFQNAFPLRNPYLQNCIEGPRPGLVEGTSQVYLAGSPVYMDGANNIVVSVVTSHIIQAFKIRGFAVSDATGVAGTEVGMRIPLQDELWVMNYMPDGGSQATAEALKGDPTNFDVYNPSTGKYYLVANDESFDATKPYGVIEEIYTSANYPGRSNQEVGDLNGLVVVSIKKGFWQ